MKRTPPRLSKCLTYFQNGIRGVTIINRLYDKYRNMLHAELNKGLSNDDLAKLLGMKSGAVYF